MDDQPPPLPVVRREPLLRGPLILTAFGRVLAVPFYSLWAMITSDALHSALLRSANYNFHHVFNLVTATIGMWNLVLLSLPLAWLFFSRHRMFRPLAVYFSSLMFLLFVGMVIHIAQFPSQSSRKDGPYDTWLGASIFFAPLLWALYYAFSPRVKRVFTR